MPRPTSDPLDRKVRGIRQDSGGFGVGKKKTTLKDKYEMFDYCDFYVPIPMSAADMIVPRIYLISSLLGYS